MKRKRADEEARTTPLGRALDREGSADAMFRSFVERASAAQAQVRRDLPTTEEDLDGAFEDVGDIAVADATDPSIPARWTETVEQLLERPEDEVVPLTQRKSTRPVAEEEAEMETMAFYSKDLVARLRAARPDTVVESSSWESVVPPPSQSTQRREAEKLVPDVDKVQKPEAPPHERSEDGLAPSGELDRILTRRFAEFYVANARPDLAMEQLFTLASGLFERRNVEGMRQALEQVLRIDATNERARRLVALLEQRPLGDAPKRR